MRLSATLFWIVLLLVVGGSLFYMVRAVGA